MSHISDVMLCAFDDFNDNSRLSNYDASTIFVAVTSSDMQIIGHAFSTINTQLPDEGWIPDLALKSAQESAQKHFEEVGPFYVAGAFHAHSGKFSNVIQGLGTEEEVSEMMKDVKKIIAACYEGKKQILDEA